MAHLNRAGQGLSEMVTICLGCRQRVIFIFDISNEVYQTWWARQLGDLYVRQYDGPARQLSLRSDSCRARPQGLTNWPSFTAGKKVSPPAPLRSRSG